MWFLTLRRSPVRWFVPFALVASLAVLLVRDRYWIGVWSETSAAAQIPALLVSGLSAAAAAWSVGSTARHGTVEQTLASALPRWRRELSGVVGALFYFAVVSLAVQAVAVAFTVRTNPPGFGMWAGYLLMGLVVTVLSVAFGHVIGKWLSGRFAAAVAGLSWFIVATYLGQSLALTVLSGPVYEQVDELTMVVRLLAALALVAVAVMVPSMDSATRAVASGAESVPRRSRPLVLTSAVAVFLLLFAAMLGNPITARQPTTAALCQGAQRVVICLWPAHEKYRAMVSGIIDRAERLPPELKIPPHFDEYGLSFRPFSTDSRNVDLTTDHLPYFILTEGSIWSVSGPIAVETVKNSLTFCEGDVATKGQQLNDTVTELQDWLEAYLAGGGRPDYHTSAAAERKAIASRAIDRANSGDIAAQLSWAATVIKDYNGASCR
ncbi:hypothetical protein [Dactylosporangium sp. NPDC000521]|uniref:hypothetical protein n=1 Tax=Dactylosporangium sp. NPDC000521 TaxID=3363975 RepID=UPI0036C231D1